MSSRAAVGGLAAAVFLVFALACSARSEAPDVEQRAQDLNKTIMCPVCPGESIDQSQHPLAAQMRGIVDRRLQEGWTEEQIADSFVESYGPRVLLEPPASGISLMVWVVPPAAVVLAGGLLFLALRTLSSRRGRERPEALALTDAEREEYTRRVESLIGD